MNLIKKLVVLIASAGAMGSAQAIDQTYDLGTLSPTVQQQTEFFASGGSFVDIYNFTIGTEYQTLATSAVSYSPTGTGIVSDLTLTLYGGADGTGSVLGSVSSSNGGAIDYSNLFASGSFSAKVSGLADGQAGGGYAFSVAAVPEPSGWMMLLAGLAVVGFMARRKASLAAG